MAVLGPGSTAAQAEQVDAVQIVQVTPAGDQVDLVVALPERLTGQVMADGAFTVTSAEGPVEIGSVAAVPADQSAAAVVLDDRASTAPSDLLASQGAAIELVRALEASTPLSVVATSAPYVRQPLSTDRDASGQAIGSVKVTEGGDLVAAVRAALDALRENYTAPVVAVFTPGSGLAPADSSALRAEAGRAGASLTVLDSTGAVPGDLIPTIDQLTGSLTGRYRLTVARWGDGPATLHLTVGGRTYEAQVPALAPAAPAAPAAAPSTEAPSTEAPATAVPSSLPTSLPTSAAFAQQSGTPPATTAAPAAAPQTSSSGTRKWRIVGLEVIGMAALAVVLWVRRRRPEATTAPVAPDVAGSVDGVKVEAAPQGSAAAIPIERVRRSRVTSLPRRARAHPPRWADMPALDDLLAWSGRGVSPGRTWVVSPSAASLRARWAQLIGAPAAAKRRLLFEGRGTRTVDAVIDDGLPGYPARPTPIGIETRSTAMPIRYARRSFDRQWLIPDRRVIDRPNVALWSLRHAPGQMFLTTAVGPMPPGGPRSPSPACCRSSTTSTASGAGSGRSGSTAAPRTPTASSASFPSSASATGPPSPERTCSPT